MKWEDILKISAGERSDAERFADPKDLLMNDSEMRKFVLSHRKRLNFLTNRPKKIAKILRGLRQPVPVLEDFLIKEAELIRNMNLDFLDKKLKNIEDELNRDAPNMFKIKRMKESYLNSYRDAIKPLRELQRKKSMADDLYSNMRR